MSEARKGRKFGPISEEHKEAIRRSNMTRVVSEETKDKIRQKAIGRSPSSETRTKMSKNMADRWKDTEYRAEMSKIISKNMKGRTVSKDARVRISKKAIERWKDEEYRSKWQAGVNHKARSEHGRQSRRKNWPKQVWEFCDNREYAISVLKSFDHKPTYAEVSKKLGFYNQYIGKAIRKFGLIDMIRYSDYSDSEQERQMFAFIKQTHASVEKTRHHIHGFELDAFVPELNVAFEYDGMFWHSEMKVGKTKQLLKTNLCNEEGIKLIHIFENEWVTQQDKIKDIINEALCNNTVINLQNAEAKQIDNQVAIDFANANKLYGGKECVNSIGLFVNDDLLSTMSFAKPRLRRFDGLEIVNDCTAIGYTSKDAYSVMLDNAVRLFDIKHAIAYADRSKNDIEKYERTKMRFVKNVEPYHSVIVDNTRFSDCYWSSSDRDEENYAYKVFNCGYSIYEI
jgi:hypothetical protein